MIYSKNELKIETALALKAEQKFPYIKSKVSLPNGEIVMAEQPQSAFRSWLWLIKQLVSIYYDI